MPMAPASCALRAGRVVVGALGVKGRVTRCDDTPQPIGLARGQLCVVADRVGATSKERVARCHVLALRINAKRNIPEATHRASPGTTHQRYHALSPVPFTLLQVWQGDEPLPLVEGLPRNCFVNVFTASNRGALNVAKSKRI